MRGVSTAPVRPYGGVGATERIAARRQRLIDAAVELYGTRGYAETGVNDICRESGLTTRYFYESFRDSSELFTAAFDSVTADLLATVAQRVAEVEAEPETQVRTAIRTFVRALADDPRKARLIFSEAPSAGAAVDHHVRATLRRFAQLVAETARPHVRELPEPFLQLGALSLVGAIERVMVEWQDGHVDADLDQVTDHLVAFFLAAGAAVGVAPTPRRHRR